MIGQTYRKVKRKMRWFARLVGVFCGFFAFEYLSASPHPPVLGVADPYAGAVVGYLVGNLLVTIGAIWMLGIVTNVFSRLLGRR